MGNHAAGKAVGLAAELALSRRRPGETALDLLDAACRGYHGTDAEFEAEDPDNPGRVHPEFGDYRDPHPKAALGMLMLEAFAPNGVADLARYAPMLGTCSQDEEAQAAQDAAYDLWSAEVDEPFTRRYRFC